MTKKKTKQKHLFTTKYVKKARIELRETMLEVNPNLDEETFEEAFQHALKEVSDNIQYKFNENMLRGLKIAENKQQAGLVADPSRLQLRALKLYLDRNKKHHYYLNAPYKKLIYELIDELEIEVRGRPVMIQKDLFEVLDDCFQN